MIDCVIHRASSSSASKAGRDSQASGPVLKRSNSLPAQSPSHPRPPAEVKPVRPSITRPYPDMHPPEDFLKHGDIRKGAEVKRNVMGVIDERYFLNTWLVKKIEGSPDYKQFVESVHPRIEKYTQENKLKAYNQLAFSHPKLTAEIASIRNALYTVPNYPTSSRFMEPREQKFLSEAMQLIREDTKRSPFHIHGESGAIGNRNGEVTWFGHNAGDSIDMCIRKGDQYALHSHPPYAEPTSSSASEPDHFVAAKKYLLFNNKMNDYLTNGQDVFQVSPTSMHLVRLHPDPKAEKKLGKFPEAFRVPDPRMAPRPFSNHEAPASFNFGWKPPADWKPPEDYPRDPAPDKNKGPSTSGTAR